MILNNTFVHISHKHPGPQRGLVLYDEGYEGGEIYQLTLTKYDRNESYALGRTGIFYHGVTICL